MKSQVIFPRLQADLANYLYQGEVHSSHRLRMAKKTSQLLKFNLFSFAMPIYNIILFKNTAYSA